MELHVHLFVPLLEVSRIQVGPAMLYVSMHVSF